MATVSYWDGEQENELQDSQLSYWDGETRHDFTTNTKLSYWDGTREIPIFPSNAVVPDPIPAPPTNLSAGTRTQTSVVLSWTGSAGATGYAVFSNGTQVATPSNSPYTVTGLSAGTQYSFSVRATNAVGSSANSNIVSVTTEPAAAIATTAVLSVAPTTTATQGATVVLTASISPAAAAGSVQFRDGGANLGAPLPVSGGTAELTTTSLPVGARALTAVFTPTNPAHFTSSNTATLTYTISTPDPEPAFQVTLANSTTTTARIAWTNVPSTATAVRVTRNAGGGESGPWSTEVTPTTTEHTFLYLTPGATYIFTAEPLPSGPAVQVTTTMPQPAPSATATTTLLAASPSGSAAQGATVTLTATVSPSTAAGTVQFRDGSNAIGAAVNVSGGTATRTTSALPTGNRSLSAVFTPANTTQYHSSTSALLPYSITTVPVPGGPRLPQFGFSFNGSSLSGMGPGAALTAHYQQCSDITPGTVWARIGFGRPSNNQVGSGVGQYVDTALAAGMNLIMRASFTTSEWETGNINAAAYGEWVENLARWCKNRGLGPDRVIFEHPNEMNGRCTGQAYRNAAAAAYPRLKSVDPNYKIVGASENVYASNWQSWLTSVYAAGYASVSDGISWHNYDQQGNNSRWQFMENLLGQHGANPANTNYMCVMTEFGSTTPPGASGNGGPSAGIGGQTEAGQSLRITELLKYFRDSKSYVDIVCLYADVDIPSRKTSDPFEAFFGIWRNNAQGQITGAKPAVQAIRNLYAQQG